MKVTRVEKHNINKSNKFYNMVDELCRKSKNMYNYGNYIVRQEFIQTSKDKENGLCENAHMYSYADLCSICKDSEPYKDLGSNVGQATLKILCNNWKSFFAAIKDYKKNPSKYLGRPKLPKYLDKENGRFICGLTNNKFKIIDGYIFFCWKPLKVMNEHFKTNIDKDSKLIQIRFVPKQHYYTMEIIYEIDVPDENMKKSERITAIDLGVNNLMTIMTNCGVSPIVINGKPLKSINQYYNKEISRMRSDLKLKHNKDWSNEMQRFTTKRNNKVNDYIHKATKEVIKFCMYNEIDTLVCGYNAGWKQEVNMSKSVNQKFTSIPYNMIVQCLEYKCQNVGIKFIQTNESYTSGTSFLDNEEPVKENYDKSRRVHRGLFISNNGTEINSDVNGSYQIMKKVFPNAFDKWDIGCDCHPVIINV